MGVPTAILASFFGKGFTGWLMEIIGRRWTISMRWPDRSPASA
jgi:hypothetical protein